MKEITPQQVIQIVENSPNLTLKEREKGLALALFKIAKNSMELKFLWDVSSYIIQSNFKQTIKFDVEFIININKNPAGFVNYK